MPACTQITLTPVTITSTGMTSTNTAGVYPLDTTSPAFTSVQSTANNAWSAVLGKNTIYYATSAPTGGTYTVGDTWFNTSAGNQMSTWNGSSWVVQQFSTAAFAGGSVDLSKLASGSVDASKLLSGAVTYGKIAAGAVGATEIAANSIVAGNIASSTITSSQIAAGTITGSNIAAGTIVAGNIATGTITATQISSGYVYAGTINASQINAGTLSAGMVAAGTFYTSDVVVGGTISTTGVTYCYGGLTSGAAAYMNSSLYGSSSIYSSTPITGRTLLIGPGSTYQIGTSSSTRRVKQDIAPSSFNPEALLDLPMQQFRYIADVEANGDKAEVQHGLMAEDLAEAGLEWLIDRDDQGQPDYIYWNERMPQALLALIQQQAKTIAALESRVTALEPR